MTVVWSGVEDGKRRVRKRGGKRRAQAGRLGLGARKTQKSADAGQVEGGVDRLEEAADCVVSARSDELAGALMDAALEGDVGCAKMLVALSERRREVRKEEEHRKRIEAQGPSLALRLAAEPEWKGPRVGVGAGAEPSPE